MIQSHIRTAVFYLVLVGSVRLMGKRQVGQMEPSEFVVTMLLANLAAIPMGGGDTPAYRGLIPILTVLGLELLLSGICVGSVPVRRLLCGKPVILVQDGTILPENLRRTRVTLDELSGLLREKQVLDVRTVQYAILETNGNLSVFVYPGKEPASAEEAGVPVKSRSLAVTLVSDGHLIRENLAVCRRSRRWVERTLKEHHATVKNTLLLSLDGEGNVIFQEKKGRK